LPPPPYPPQVFTGDRPSLSLLFPRLDAFTAGQLLAIYEHRTAVQGFVWGINSFDQWGVELGKVLAKQVRGEGGGVGGRGVGAGGEGGSSTSCPSLGSLLHPPSMPGHAFKTQAPQQIHAHIRARRACMIHPVQRA
ncbi:unnamed protein product, partial [Discosporangium mesarthrocarpum]